MRILDTNILFDTAGHEQEIILPIKIEKGDAVTPISVFFDLKDWFAELNSSGKSSLQIMGVGSSSLLYNAVTQEYSLCISIWNRNSQNERLSFCDVMYYLADCVWKEARAIYEDRNV